jgi:hypothetical protein
MEAISLYIHVAQIVATICYWGIVASLVLLAGCGVKKLTEIWHRPE